MTAKELGLLAMTYEGWFYELTQETRFSALTEDNREAMTALWRKGLVVQCSFIAGKATPNGRGFGYMASDKGRHMVETFVAMMNLMA